MQEKDVVKSVKEYLSNEKYLSKPQFETQEGRVDIAGFKWISNYEIASIGVECKATTNPKAIMKTLREQIFSYQKYFPKVYLAIPKGGDYATITNLCKSSDVGHMSIDNNKKTKIELEAPDLSPVFDDSSYRREVLPNAIIWLTFTDIFGNDVLRSSQGWISTKGKVQFNLWLGSIGTNFGVNVEDTRKVLLNVGEKNLYSVMKNETPIEACLWVAKEKYFGRGFRTGLTIMKKSIRDVKPEDITHIFDVTRSGSTNLHLGVYKEVWKYQELLDRKTYQERIKKAQDELNPLYALLKSPEPVS